MPPDLDPALIELPLERLRRRRSVKWSRYEPDVLPAPPGLVEEAVERIAAAVGRA